MAKSDIPVLYIDDDIIVIDAGMMFPDAELLGVDIVTPDFAYLEEHREMVRGLDELYVQLLREHGIAVPAGGAAPAAAPAPAGAAA